MKPRQATLKASGRQSISGRVKTSVKHILDRVFLRSKVLQISRTVPQIERNLDESVTLLSKKMDYLLAKSEAYAEVDDRNHATLGKVVNDISERTKKLEEMNRRLLGLPEPEEEQPSPEKQKPALIEPDPEGKATVLVELLGPSGVGKSTILRAAQALRSPEEMWWGPSEIDATIAAPGANRKTQRDAVDNFSPSDFVPRCLEFVTSSRMLASQMISASSQLRETCQAALSVRNLSSRHPLVHDELLLHRASSLLLYSDAFEDQAAWYFDTVPAPAAVIVVRADVDTIVQRVQRRSERRINTYYNLDDDALREIVGRSLRLTEIAVERLRRRGVAVMELDAGREPAESAQMLHSLVSAMREALPPSGEGFQQTHDENKLKERLRIASGSFRKKEGRHKLKTENVIYCAFSTGRFSVGRHEAQRSAPERLARFGLARADVEGRTVLDLGCHNGAMLLELSNFDPALGLGIEYDADKVILAQDIATYSGLANLRFEQGDLNQIAPEALGTFDIVFALAIESHVLDPERLYALLGKVTDRLLCFEGNGGCDVDDAKRKLLANGFKSVDYIGFCNDDIVPANNKRPMLVARK